MFYNYFKIAWRNVKKHKGYSFINVAGLAVGLAVAILILLYVQFETSFDRYHEKADRIYRVMCTDTESGQPWYVTPAPLGPEMMEAFPEVAATVRMRGAGRPHMSYQDKRFFENTFQFADATIFNVFSIKLLKGHIETAFKGPFSLIISESMAVKYFGNEDPLGKTMTFSNTHDFVVTGVLKNMPANSHLVMDFIAPFETLEKMYSWMRSGNWDGFMYYTYVLVKEDADLKNLEPKLSQLMKQNLSEEIAQGLTFSFQPLRKIYLYPDRIKSVHIFTSISILILILACINYINLATARSTRRMKEIGIRKVVGAHRLQLVKQLLFESFLLTLLAFFIAVIMVPLLLPAFNRIIESNLRFHLIENRQFLFWLIPLILSVGLLSGSWPALALSSLIPTSVLNRKLGSFSGSLLRNILVVAQFTIAIILIITTFVIHNQLNFIQNTDAGFQREHIVVVDVRDRHIKDNIAFIQNELKQNPHVIAASASMSLPNETGMKSRMVWPGKADHKDKHILLNYVDYDFVELYGLRIVEGRNFSKDFPSDAEGAFLINETAVKVLGWQSAIGKELTHWGLGESRGKVVGVLEDFHLNSFHKSIEPICIDLNTQEASENLSIKIMATDVSQTIAFIKRTIAKYSQKYPFEYHFFDDIYNQAYKLEKKMEELFSVFALLAIFIGSLGLMGLASFMAEQRTKEIGIRKVMGSSVSGIVRLFTKEFAKWIILANMIAWPIGYFIGNRWLGHFAYRTDIGVSLFILSALSVLLIVMLIVGYQAGKAARTNPVESLRYE